MARVLNDVVVNVARKGIAVQDIGGPNALISQSRESSRKMIQEGESCWRLLVDGVERKLA